MMIYGCPSHRHSSSSLYSSFLITLSWCGHVTGVVTCHNSAWHFITWSHSHADVESCVDVMIGPHKVPRDLLPRSSVSNLLSKLQSKKILKLNSMEVEKKTQRMTKNQLGIICLFLRYPSSLNIPSCWPEKESSVVLRTTNWKYFQSTDIFNRARLRQGFKSNLSKTFPIHLGFVESWTFQTIAEGPPANSAYSARVFVRWGNCGLLCNFNLAIT